MPELADWLKSNKIVHAMAGPTSCYIFTPPPGLSEAYGAAVMPKSIHGREVARSLRSVGWAVFLTNKTDEALHWLRARGYGCNRDGSTVLRLPTGFRTFGSMQIDLVRMVELIVKDPAITTRKLADKLTEIHGRRIERQAVNRAMIAVGWGPEQREACRSGHVGPPTMVQE